LTGLGIPEIWDRIGTFYRELEPKGVIANRRHQQSLDWLTDLIRDELPRRFYQDPSVIQLLPQLRQALLRGEITAFNAAQTLLDAHLGQRNKP
jgi:putative protein kinase ArgK-like GTPase of G3E family